MSNILSETGMALIKGEKDRALALVLDEQSDSAQILHALLEERGYEVFQGTDFSALQELSDDQYARTQILLISTTLPHGDVDTSESLPQYFMHMFPMNPILLIGEGFEDFLNDRAASMFVLSHLRRPLDAHLLQKALKRCEEYIQLFNSVLERVSFMRSAQLMQEPIARIVHDINNQITGLKGGIDLLSYSLDALEENSGKEKIDRYLNQFIIPGMSAVENILCNWRSLREQQMDVADVCDASAVTYWGIKMAATPAHLRKIHFEVMTQPAKLIDETYNGSLPRIPVQGNPRLLPLAIAHLVRNALEAVSEKADGSVKIIINKSTEQNMWSIAVHDNGPGISKEHQTDIWRSFYSTKDGLRTGLGLSLAKQIVDKCNGQISLAQSPHGGTVFEILLPAQASQHD